MRAIREKLSSLHFPILFPSLLRGKHHEFSQHRRSVLKAFWYSTPGLALALTQSVHWLSSAAELLAGIEHDAREIKLVPDVLVLPTVSEQLRKTCMIFLTDLHLAAEGEGYLTLARLEELLTGIFAQITADGFLTENIHLVLVGDLVSQSAGQGFPQTPGEVYREGIQQFQRVTANVSFVAGNHDSEHTQFDRITTCLQESGFTCHALTGDFSCVPASDKIPIHQLYLPDYTTSPEVYTEDYFLKLHQSLRNLEQQTPLVVITHNASVLDQAADGMFQQFLQQHFPAVYVVAGHTHGAMVGYETPTLSLVGDHVLKEYLPTPYLSQYTHGLYTLGTQVFIRVAQGVGNSKAQQSLATKTNGKVRMVMPRLADRQVIYLTFRQGE